MRCDLHCPKPPPSVLAVAAVIGAGVALAVARTVLQAAAWWIIAAVAVAALGGVAWIWRELTTHRMSTAAEVLNATQAVRGVPPDRAAIAARARPARGELAAPAVRLVEVRPAVQDGKVAG